MKKRGEYSSKGDYHKNLDPKWKYYPVYVYKMKFVENFLNDWPKKKKVLDVGCGEGVLIEKYIKQGYSITGIDLNYESKYVSRDDIRKPKLAPQSFDLILCLDVLEHFSYKDQEVVLRQMNKLLKKDGVLLFTVPNLAHLASRFFFLLTGNLLRTSAIERHIGDRPFGEYKKLLSKHFTILKIKSIFPTFPLISILTYLFPDKVLPLHGFINTFLAIPGFCFLNIFLCQKKSLI